MKADRDSNDQLDYTLRTIRLFSECAAVRGDVRSTSPATIAAADDLARCLHNIDIHLNRISHGATGEITFWFWKKRVEIRIVVDEDDGELLLCVRRKSDGARYYGEATSSANDAATVKDWLSGRWAELFERA